MGAGGAARGVGVDIEDCCGKRLGVNVSGRCSCAGALRYAARGELACVSDHRLVLQLARLLQRTELWSLLAISNRATIAVVKSTVDLSAARASTATRSQ